MIFIEKQSYHFGISQLKKVGFSKDNLALNNLIWAKISKATSTTATVMKYTIFISLKE
jgi:hypothetical protein